MDWCDNCALKLYNTKAHNLQGIGNPWNGICIVVPNVDYEAYKSKNMSFSSQVEVIKEVLSLTGDVLSNVYIIPLIRCNENISCKLDGATYNKCLHWLAKDVRTYNFQNILLLGDAARRFLNCDIKPYLKTIIVSNNNRKYFVNYAPLIKYTDSDKFEIFKENLIEWYSASLYNCYPNYEIKKV